MPELSTTNAAYTDEDAVNPDFLHYLVRGAELLQSGTADQARTTLEQALKLSPKNHRGQNLLALSYFKLGLYDQAEVLYRGLIEDNPLDANMLVNLGVVQLKMGRPDEAVISLLSAVQKQPEHVKAANYLGLAYTHKREFPRAKQWFDRAGNTVMVEKVSALEKRLVDQTNAAKSQTSIPPIPRPVDVPIRPTEPQFAPVSLAPLPSLAPMPAAPNDVAIMGELSLAPEATMDVAAPPPGHITSPFGVHAVSAADMRNHEQAAPPDMPEDQRTPTNPYGTERLKVPGMMPAPDDGLADPSTEMTVAPPPTKETTPVGERSAPELKTFSAATRLVPAVGAPFSITPTLISIQVTNEIFVRVDGLVATFGTLELKPAFKRFRGRVTEKPFGDPGQRMMHASGKGRLCIVPGNRRFQPVEIGDEPAYFREDTLFAFEESLLFENGRVPSKLGADLQLVHLRNRGRALIVSRNLPRSIDVIQDEPCRVLMSALIGWHGNITPRVVAIADEATADGQSMAGVELLGEGRVLLDAAL